MKEIIKRALVFVRNNLTIISSIALIFVVIGALFLNAYVTIKRFQEHQDQTLRSKAVMAENIINIAAMNYFADREQINQLQQELQDIQKRQSEITQIRLFAYDSSLNQYLPVSTSVNQQKQSEIIETIAENAQKFALSVNDAFAYISNEDGNRFWNVVKAVKDASGNNQGILLIKMSLAENDALVEQTITRVYLLSLASVLVVLLLVINHIRLFGFEVKARKLEEIDHMKDDFISMASHELKSPLTAIRGYSELINEMLDQQQSEEIVLQQKKYLHSIELATERLKTLVEDLLDVSRLEQNRLPIVCQPIEVNSIIENIMVEMQIMADQKKLKIINSLPIFSKINADPERMKQVVINLVSNAIKYTPHGSIELKGKEDENWVYLTVADTGIGISPQNMQKLFSKFFRVHTSETYNISGTGLGLWIVKEVTEKMGGELIVESIEGVGSHFTLKLKKA